MADPLPVVEVVQGVFPLQLEGHAVGEAGPLLHQGGHPPRLPGLPAVRLVTLPEPPGIALHIACRIQYILSYYYITKSKRSRFMEDILRIRIQEVKKSPKMQGQGFESAETLEEKK